MVNVDLARQTLQEIRDHEDRWNQHQWIELQDSSDPACGTTLCFAGFAACLAGAKFVPVEKVTDNGELAYYYQPPRVITPEGDDRHVEAYAADVLGLDPSEAHSIFYFTVNDIDALTERVEQVIAGEDEEAVTE